MENKHTLIIDNNKALIGELEIKKILNKKPKKKRSKPKITDDKIALLNSKVVELEQDITKPTKIPLQMSLDKQIRLIFSNKGITIKKLKVKKRKIIIKVEKDEKNN